MIGVVEFSEKLDEVSSPEDFPVTAIFSGEEEDLWECMQV